MLDTKQIVDIAWNNGFVIPAFNIPYLPMMKPVIEAIRDENSFALVQVARLEWEKFESKSLKAVRDEYECWKDEKHVRLHLDHVPAIDEDAKIVDYMPIINEAVELGYDSLMIDASRLSLEENIEATKKVCAVAHQAGLACEAELGAVLGHESGPLPPYDEMFASGESFTKVDEAARFVAETGCDWLSVAIGNIHGAISEATRGQTKIAAKLDIQHLKKLKDITNIPLVLHGGSGIRNEYIIEAIKNGIAKINVGTEIRQAYEREAEKGDIEAGRKAVYLKTREIIKEHYRISDTADIISSAGKE
ncbi:MAG: class II fructose-bisphosphate aldolase [Clostridiaceae bacterium]|nr:class II fructose-bisphosphate aldolase [Clostridiaceae bacterium]